jgi:hypothetical protein
MNEWREEGSNPIPKSKAFPPEHSMSAFLYSIENKESRNGYLLIE